MNLNAFTSNLQKYADLYNPNELFDKIKKVARKAGVNIIYVVLLLYYSTLDKELPVKDRLMVIAALGYFILPLDAAAAAVKRQKHPDEGEKDSLARSRLHIAGACAHWDICGDFIT